MPYSPERVPEDILPPIFEQITDQRDLHACSLVSWTFNRAVTPILYRSWDTRVILDLPASGRFAKTPKVFHPVKTLLAKKELLQYVRHARGTGTIHKHGTEQFEEALAALRLCTHLQTFTWTDDQADRLNKQAHADPVSHDVADQSLREVIKVLHGLHITELTIRTYSGLSEEAWTEMRKLTGLKRLALWCVEGRPRVLQGWSETLGSTLTHLELGRCQGVPATILLSVLSQLPLLQSLGIKGAPSNSIPDILMFLPNLKSLDTDYLSSGAKTIPNDQPLLAHLEHLTVRTNELAGPRNIWRWIKQLVPHPSLESFKLNAFSVQGDGNLPRRFILDLARVHEKVLKQFHVTGTALALQDIQCLCAMFPNLEELSWSIMFSSDITEVGEAVANADNLRSLQVDADWVSVRMTGLPMQAKFDINDARKMMLRKGSQLRNIYISGVSFRGKWIPVIESDGSTKVEFEIVRDESGYNRLQ